MKQLTKTPATDLAARATGFLVDFRREEALEYDEGVGEYGKRSGVARMEAVLEFRRPEYGFGLLIAFVSNE